MQHAPSALPLTHAASADGQERDLWWGSFALRTMLPSFAVCIGLTAGIIGLGTYLTLSYDLDGDSVRYFGYGLAWIIWCFQVLRWGYRILAFNYRLTTRRLFYKQGFLYPPQDGLALADIAQVVIEQNWLERELGIGRIRIIPTKNPVAQVELQGVINPQRIGKLIEEAVQKAAPGQEPPESDTSCAKQ